MYKTTTPQQEAPPQVACLRSLLSVLLTVLALQASGGALAQAGRYAFSPDEQEVTDTATQLVWRRCAEGQVFGGGTCSGTALAFTHEAALLRAKAEATSSGKAWRLPNVKELSSLVDRSRSIPAIDVIAFPATPPDRFWSASQAGSSAWAVFFWEGSLNPSHRSHGLQLRLVRDSQ